MDVLKLSIIIVIALGLQFYILIFSSWLDKRWAVSKEDMPEKAPYKSLKTIVYLAIVFVLYGGAMLACFFSIITFIPNSYKLFPNFLV